MVTYITDIPNAPKAVGPYSPAASVGGFTFLSGQIALNPETNTFCEGGIEEQAEQVLKNIKAVLTFIGKDFADIVKTTIFLTDLSTFQTVNGIYAKWLGASKPARSTVQVAALPFNAQIEIECIVAR